MNSTYQHWIDDYVAANKGYVRGHCSMATKAMCEAFPELKRVAGHVALVGGGRAEHFWCVAPDGDIVDPTASQFVKIGGYEPFKPGAEVRIGTCMNCGGDIVGGVQTLDDPRPKLPAGASTSACSVECEAALQEYYR